MRVQAPNLAHTLPDLREDDTYTTAATAARGLAGANTTGAVVS